MTTHSLFGIKAGNMSTQILFSRLEFALYCASLAMLLPSSGQSSKVEFYEQHNYVDFLAEEYFSSDSAGKCFNILDPMFRSVKTDRCVIFYSRPDCILDNTIMYLNPNVAQTFKVVQNEPALDTLLEDYIRPLGARSFHLCSQEKGGGPQVDVQLYPLPHLHGDVKESYWNMCGCKNIPLSLNLGKLLSIDNHGNGIEIFSQEYCQGQKVEIPAGRNLLSQYAPTKMKFDVRSIRPVSTHDCIKLKATITKFYFANATQNHLPQKMKLATSTKIRNNGAAKITQEYSLSERVVDTLDITVAEAFTKINNVDTFANFENEVETGFPLVGKIKFEIKFGITYAFQRADSESKSDRVVNSTERSVSSKQSVDIPACKECILTSFMKEMANFPFKYTAYARVSGTGGREPLTAAEVRQNLPDGAEYIRDFDANTVEMMAKGDMKADYGIEAFIDVECQPIPGCNTGENGLPSNSKQNYEILVPIN